MNDKLVGQILYSGHTVIKNPTFHPQIYAYQDTRSPSIPGMQIVAETEHWTVWKWRHSECVSE